MYIVYPWGSLPKWPLKRMAMPFGQPAPQSSCRLQQIDGAQLSILPLELAQEVDICHCRAHVTEPALALLRFRLPSLTILC